MSASIDPIALLAARVSALYLPPADRAQGTVLLRALLAAEAAGHAQLPLAAPLFAKFVVEAGGDPQRLRVDFSSAESPLGARVAPLFAENGPLSFGHAGGAPGRDAVGNETVATRRAFAEERAIAEKIHAFARSQPPLPRNVAAETTALARIFEAPVPLHQKQQEAVSLALLSRFSVITGGPGTGKTSVVFALLRAVLEPSLKPMAPERILLAAPTGKAAQRLGESLRGSLSRLAGKDPTAAGAFEALQKRMPEPATLHRLLGWDPVALRFRFDANAPLDAELVVVDEASMIDLPLFNALLDALPKTAKLVLLGDADQLPSVGPGAVLRDLVRFYALCTESLEAGVSPPYPVALLTESYRMDPKKPGGRHVLLFARAVLASGADGGTRFTPGREAMPKVYLGYDGFLAAGKAVGVNVLPPTEATLASLTDAAARFFLGDFSAISRVFAVENGELSGDGLPAARALLAVHERFRILSPLKEMPRFGVRALNEQVHAHYTRRFRAAELQTRASRGGDASDESFDYRFLRGEPVMVTANDYRRSLWNGDQGIVVLARRDGAPARPEVLFLRGEAVVAHPLAAITDRLVHAYALSVHKAQGSEFDRIVLVLPPQGHPLADKGSLYTAATRARDAVVLVTGGVGLSRAATTRTERFTGLIDALRLARS